MLHPAVVPSQRRVPGDAIERYAQHALRILEGAVGSPIDPAMLPLVAHGAGYWARNRGGAGEPAVSDYLTWRQWDELAGPLSF